MGKVILIIGLPGSGKTTLAKLEYPDYVLIDDPKVKPELNLGKDYVICDPWLCDAGIRQKCRDSLSGFEIIEIYFENNPEKCMKNVRNRLDDRIITSFKVFNYSVPAGIETRKVWND